MRLLVTAFVLDRHRMPIAAKVFQNVESSYKTNTCERALSFHEYREPVLYSNIRSHTRRTGLANLALAMQPFGLFLW
ncbi:hypothetical protein EB809_17120 [Marinobacter sp. R17]|nr:hypothetical protein EB809_17120 [Marinobacter sp. R17]